MELVAKVRRFFRSGSRCLLSPDRGVGYRSRGCGRNDQTPGSLPRSKSPAGAQDGSEPRIPTPHRGFIGGGTFPGVWLHIATLVRPHPRPRHLPPLSGLAGRLSSLVQVGACNT